MQSRYLTLACALTLAGGLEVAHAAPLVVGLPTPITDITTITPYADGGFYLFATGGSGGANGPSLGLDISHLPWVSSFGLPTDAEAHGYGYNTLGTPFGNFTTGTISDGTNLDKFSFTLNAAAPSTFTIDVLVDNLNGAGFNASSLTVTPVGGVAATLAELPGNGQSDLYQFVVSGATAGSVFDVGATAGVNGTATIAGITFSTSTPEPASLGLLGLGAIGLLSRRRRL